jgi:hypothetical protein
VGTTIPKESLYATGLAIQHSGDVVVAGYTQSFSGSFTQGFAMARYAPNGNPDPTFGTNGIQTTFFPNAGASNVALETDDNIVVAGTVTDPVTGNADFGVAEYLGHPPAPADPNLAAGLASPSGAIPGRVGGSLGIGGAAIVQPPTASSSVSQSDALPRRRVPPNPLLRAFQQPPAAALERPLSAPFSGATNQAPSNQDGSFLDGMNALLPAAQSPSLTVVGSTFVPSKLVPSPAISSSPTAAFVAALSEALSHAVGMPDSGNADVLDPSALDALFASADVLERSALDTSFAPPG